MGLVQWRRFYIRWLHSETLDRQSSLFLDQWLTSAEVTILPSILESVKITVTLCGVYMCMCVRVHVWVYVCIYAFVSVLVYEMKTSLTCKPRLCSKPCLGLVMFVLRLSASIYTASPNCLLFTLPCARYQRAIHTS